MCVCVRECGSGSLLCCENPLVLLEMLLTAAEGGIFFFLLEKGRSEEGRGFCWVLECA
jgi:hypothetical protein